MLWFKRLSLISALLIILLSVFTPMFQIQTKSVDSRCLGSISYASSETDTRITASDFVDLLETNFRKEIIDKAGPLGDKRDFVEMGDVGFSYKYKKYSCAACWFPEYQCLLPTYASRAYYFHVDLPIELGNFGWVSAVKIMYGQPVGAALDNWADIWISVDRLDRAGCEKGSCKECTWEEAFQAYLNLEQNKGASIKDYGGVKILDAEQECTIERINTKGEKYPVHCYLHRREIHTDRIITYDWNTEFGNLCPDGCWATIRVAIYHESDRSIVELADLKEDFEDLWDFVLRMCMKTTPPIVVEGSGAPTPKALKAYFTYSVSGLTVTFDASTSTGDFEGMRSIDIYWWEGKTKDGKLAFLERGGPVISHEFSKPGVYIVRLTVKDRNGNEKTFIQEVKVGVASLQVSVNPSTFQASTSEQELEITVKVIDPDGKPCKALIDYEAKMEPPLIYESGMGETDESGVITFKKTLPPLYSQVTFWCKVNGLNVLDFHGVLKVKVHAFASGWAAWEAEKVVTIDVTFQKPNIEVSTWCYEDDENIVARLDYANEYKTRDFERFSVHLTGEIRNDYPVSMKLCIFSGGSKIPINDQGKYEITLGSTPIWEQLSTKVDIWPNVELNNQKFVKILMYQDIVTELTEEAIRVIIQVIPGGETISRTVTETLLAYDIFVKIRNSVKTKLKSGGFSLLDAPGLILTAIDEHKEKVLETLKKGLESLNYKKLAASLTLKTLEYAIKTLSLSWELGMFIYNIYSTPAVTEERWVVTVIMPTK